MALAQKREKSYMGHHFYFSNATSNATLHCRDEKNIVLQWFSQFQKELFLLLFLFLFLCLSTSCLALLCFLKGLQLLFLCLGSSLQKQRVGKKYFSPQCKKTVAWTSDVALLFIERTRTCAKIARLDLPLQQDPWTLLRLFLQPFVQESPTL